MAAGDADPTPIRNAAYRVTFAYMTTGAIQPSPAGLAATVSKDGGAFGATTNAPVEAPAASGQCHIDLTATEMDADTVVILPTTSTVGAVGPVIVIQTYTVGNTTVATAAAVAAVQADTDDVQTRLPAALVGGRMDSSTGAMAAGVVTAAAVATDAIDNDAIATSAVTEINAAVLAALALVQTDTDDLQVSAAAIVAAIAALPTAVAVAAIKTVVDEISVDTDNLLTGQALQATAAALAAGLGALAAGIAAVQADTDDLQLSAAAILAAIAATPGSVLLEALSELSGDPGDEPTVGDALQLLYQAERNEQASDDTFVTITKGDGTVILTAAVATAGALVTRGKFTP